MTAPEGVNQSDPQHNMFDPFPMSRKTPATPNPVWRHLYWILAVAFCARAGIALSGDFVLHPDEIMQYLEPAHGAVFGTGITFWEFLYGTRSWLVPGLVSVVLWACNGLGVDDPAFYIPAVKLVFCAISLAIPASMYAAGRRLYGERTGRIALVLGSFWYELVGFAHKPMTEFVATALFLVLLSLMLRPPEPRRAATAVSLAVLTVAVRMQYAIAIGILLMWDFIRSGKRTRLIALFAALAALAGIGLFEYLTWGSLFHSYHLNLLFNLMHDRSGESAAWNYIGWLMLASGGTFLAAVVVGIRNWRQHLLLLVLMLAMLLPHMAIDHREYRFVFAIIPIWLLLFANLLAEGWRFGSNSSGAHSRSHPVLGLAYATVISGLGILNLIPGQHHVYTAYSNEARNVSFIFRQDPIFAIYRRLSMDSSVCGVLDATRTWQNTPGYYYLHKQIPFYDVAHVYHDTLLTSDNFQDYVSHIVAITGVPEQRTGIYRNSDGETAIKIADRLQMLPAIMVDGKSEVLMYMHENGRLTELEGYALSERIGDISIWTSRHRHAQKDFCQVHKWVDYAPFAAGMPEESIRNILENDRPIPTRGPRILAP